MYIPQEDMPHRVVLQTANKRATSRCQPGFILSYSYLKNSFVQRQGKE
jgi:hypothetical protein